MNTYLSFLENGHCIINIGFSKLYYVYYYIGIQK